MKNRDTGESKGFAFVAYRTKDVAQKAIEGLHSKEFKVPYKFIILLFCLVWQIISRLWLTIAFVSAGKNITLFVVRD